jgi:hypothetical protein
MKAATILEDRVKRMEIQKTWKERLDKLTTSRAAFCEKEGINTSVLCRMEKCNLAAGWDWIEKIESSLKRYGL